MQQTEENRSAQRKNGLAWDRTRASVMRGRGLAASAMARPGNVTLNENTHNCKGNYNYFNLITNIRRSQWPCGLRRRSSAARLLRLWVRLPPGAWMFVCCECCVLSGRGLCDGLITHPEESYRLWCVVVCDQETSKTRRLKPATGLWKMQPQWVVTPRKQTNKQTITNIHASHSISISQYFKILVN
jgi:hypothetical protein